MEGGMQMPQPEMDQTNGTVVFTHPKGGILKIGDAVSVDGYTYETGDGVIVVDLKQDKRRANVDMVIHHPLNDDVGGLGDMTDVVAALKQIDMLLRGGNTVHVVCAMGESRSGTVVAAYVAAVLGLDFGEGLALVRNTYPNANPNPGFYDRCRDSMEMLSDDVTVLDVDDTVIFGWMKQHQGAFLAEPAAVQV